MLKRRFDKCFFFFSFFFFFFFLFGGHCEKTIDSPAARKEAVEYLLHNPKGSESEDFPLDPAQKKTVKKILVIILFLLDFLTSTLLVRSIQ